MLRPCCLLLAFAAALAAGLPAESDSTTEATTTQEVPEIEDVMDEQTNFATTVEPAAPAVPEELTLSNAITNGVSMLSSSVHNEPACLRTGGNCLPAIECPVGALTAQKGLCPEQQDLGVECCHGLSLLEKRCHMRGGQCMKASECSRALVEDRAEDCPDDKVCCVLLRS